MSINDIFNKMILNGSIFSLDELKELKKELEFYIFNNYSKTEIYNKLINELINKTEEFLDSNRISGISSSVFLNHNFYIDIIGGYKNDGSRINSNTLFDIASISKMYMGILVLKLKQMSLLDTTSLLSNISNGFNLGDYTIDDLINMRGMIKTPKRIDECENTFEAFEILKTTYIYKSNKDIFEYTDIGLIILSYLLQQKFNTSYEDLLNQYVLLPLNLRATYHPVSNVTGNGSGKLKPSDPKVNTLNHELGSAGLFTNSIDFMNLGNRLFNSAYFKHLDLNCFYQRINDTARGSFGSYTHHPLGLNISYVPKEYSSNTFSFEGYTGSIVVYDLLNQIHNSILVNALDELGMKKGKFNEIMHTYQENMTLVTLKLFIIKKYFKDKEVFIKQLKI